jgi:hypothetical protein
VAYQARPEVPVVTVSALPDSEEDRPTNLSETRAVIEQAKGILMATYRCGPDEALDLLRRASQAGGLKVHVLAAKVVELARCGLTITDVGQRETSGGLRVLILDRDPDDPRRILATVTLSSDVRPALLDAADGYVGLADAVASAESRVGRPVALVPVHDARAWHVDEGGRRRGQSGLVG